VAFIPALLAVHDDGFFELDRDATDTGTPGEDWDRVFLGTDTAAASSFTFDGEGPTIFTGGGSKDDLDTTSWQHKSGSTPPKDELLDGFVARYGNNLYFGADRVTNNGDSQMGFWFFQNAIVAQPDGTFGPGAHENGDILVLSDFSGGGANVTIRVFQWHSPGGAINGTLDLIGGTLLTPSDCVGPPSAPANDPFCATVNTTVTPSPWPFAPKSAPAGSFQPGEFYEGGIDLSFLHLENECFASFLAETRSSTSVDATLKDFVGGSFQPCVSTVKTTPSDANKNAVTSIVLGENIYDYAVITGTGSNLAPTGTMTFSICAPGELTNGACETGGTAVGLPVTVTQIAGTTNSEAISAAYTPNAIGKWCWRGEYSGDDNYPASSDASTGECFDVIQLQPAIATAQTFTVFDKATITVAAGAGDLQGNVQFLLYPNDTTCAGTPVYDSGALPVSGPSPQEVTSGTTTITLPGTHVLSWKVVYTSTKNGHKNVTSTCHTENGTVTFTNGS
jgi:hypothetical protein